jgi:hypothetical protein
MAYVLDADVLIRAKNLHYGFDFCPAFWDWLIAGNAAGKVFSIEKVGDEVLAVEDELSGWAAERGEGFFLRPDATVFPALAEVSTWATDQEYEPAAVSTFLQADGRDWEVKLELPVNRVLPIARAELPALWRAFGERG